jgi:hypothetical protein
VTEGNINHLNILSNAKEKQWFGIIDSVFLEASQEKCHTIIFSSEEALFLQKAAWAQILDQLNKFATDVLHSTLEIEFIYLERKLFSEGRGQSLHRQVLMGGFALPYVIYLPWLFLLRIDEKKKLKFLKKIEYTALEIKHKKYFFNELSLHQSKFSKDICKLFGLPECEIDYVEDLILRNNSHSKDFYKQLRNFNWKNSSFLIKFNARKSLQIRTSKKAKQIEFIENLLNSEAE